MNFCGMPNRYVTHIEQIRAAFGGSTLLVPVIADDNLLLFAFRRRIPLPTTASFNACNPASPSNSRGTCAESAKGTCWLEQLMHQFPLPPTHCPD